MLTEDPIKLIYFGPRPRDRNLSAFRQRWRQHADLGMSRPFFRHMTLYKHLDALEPTEFGLSAAGLPATAEGEIGGVGEIWVEGSKALAEVIADPTAAVMLPDEVETFGRELGNSVIPTREHLVVERGPVALSLVSLVFRAKASPSVNFSERWRQAGEHLLSIDKLSRHLSRYVQSQALSPHDDAQGFAELGFPSKGAANSFFAELALLNELASEEAGFIDHSRIINLFVVEKVLFDSSATSSDLTP